MNENSGVAFDAVSQGPMDRDGLVEIQLWNKTVGVKLKYLKECLAMYEEAG